MTIVHFFIFYLSKIKIIQKFQKFFRKKNQKKKKKKLFINLHLLDSRLNLFLKFLDDHKIHPYALYFYNNFNIKLTCG